MRSLLLSIALLMSGAASAVEPLPPEQQAIFAGTREDKPAELLHGVTASQIGRHYVTGNEWNLHLFYPQVKDLGGGYVGVGSDQAYLFIGWQKPELAWLIDYDQYVVDAHRVYQAFFLAAETPEAFLRLWTLEARVEAEKAIQDRYPKIAARVIGILRNYRAKITDRLTKVKEQVVAANVPTFLNDQATYTWVRDFIIAGRTRPMVGDLLAKKGIRAISKAAEQLNVPIRVFYMSNAEEYWDYTYEFKKNLKGVYHDDQSVVVRTLLTWARNQDYRYCVQSFGNYLDWLAKDWVVNVASIIKGRTDDSKDVEFFVMTRTAQEEEDLRRSKGKLP